MSAAPTAAGFQLRSLSGEVVRLRDFAGKVVVLAFWASGCEPCLRELPQLEQLWDRWRHRGLELLSVNVDGPEMIQTVRRVARRYAVRCPVLLDQDTEVVNLYNPSLTLPFTVVIAADGSVAASHQGYRAGDEVEIEALVEPLLAGPPP